MLLLARNKYQETKGSLGLGSLRKVRRKTADNISPWAEAAKTASALTPDNIYSTPILGAVEVVLDVRCCTSLVLARYLLTHHRSSKRLPP